MPLAILRNPSSWTSFGVDFVAFDDQHRAGVIGEHPRGQQTGDAAAQHAGGVEQHGGARWQVRSRQTIEHGTVGISRQGHTGTFLAFGHRGNAPG